MMLRQGFKKAPITGKTSRRRRKSMSFQETKTQAKIVIQDLRDLAKQSIRKTLRDQQGLFHQDLEILEHSIDTESFRVGVVGVFNTGKSMLLNALMRKPILDYHILPETAAITSLKFGAEEEATVHYWTSEQWNQIEAQGKSEDPPDGMSDITRMIKEIRESLGSSFNEYVTPEGRSDPGIQLDDLARYTSANAEGGLARLVREVEIRTNLDFCRDNISIVDTPGLNDPIRLREYVTEKLFIPRCHMILWLLPAKMVFTDYDKKFLKKQLKEGRINKLFVIVNQIDSLDSKDQIGLVVQWAKKQIQQTFQEFYGSASDASGKHELEMFPVSGKQAFLNRTGRKDEATWNEDDSGVPVFEKRLREFLFEGERATEMQVNWQVTLKNLVESELQQIHDQLSNIDEPVDELSRKVDQLKEEAEAIKSELQRVLEENEKTISHFEKQYDAQVTILSKDIPLLSPRIEERAVKKLDEFLDRNFLSVIWNMRSWSRDEFEPFLKDTVREEVEEAITNAMREIEELVREALEEFTKAYEKMVENVRVRIPETANGTDYAMLIGKAAVGAGVGLAIREMLLVALGGVSAYLYGLLSGPIGWLIVAVAALWSALRGVKNLNEKCKAELRAKLPTELRKTLEEIVKEARPKFAVLKTTLVKGLREAAEEPAKRIQQHLDEKLANLTDLLEEKKTKEFDRDQSLSALTVEKEAFEVSLHRIMDLVRGEDA